ncbi:hypothetical protein GW17_00046266, partial [Ensete ventricosum]
SPFPTPLRSPHRCFSILRRLIMAENSNGTGESDKSGSASSPAGNLRDPFFLLVGFVSAGLWCLEISYCCLCRWAV